MSKQDQDEKQGQDEKGSQNEKQEKDEKELQKQEEKSPEEKWERDRIGALVWASILIWAGVVLLASNLGAFDLMSQFMERLPLQAERFPFEIEFFPIEAWSIFWLGAAAILLLSVAVRLLLPEYRRPILGTLILSIVFLGLAFGYWNCVWPLILIAIGVSILLRNIGGNGKEK